MDLKALQSPKIQEFISLHQNDDTAKLALKLKKADQPYATEILKQIKGRQKAKNKIPSWLQPGILFPESISLEQCSSEATAKFKTALVSGKCLIDLSAGFGVDAFYFSRVMEKVIMLEPDNNLAELAAHNFPFLGVTNATIINSRAEEFLQNFNDSATWIYADPSRRSASNKKLHKLEDCQPEIPSLLPRLFDIAPNIFIKASPLLDIQAALDALFFTKKIIVLSHNNECKELLFLLEKDFKEEPETVAIELNPAGRQFSFRLSEEKETVSSFSPVLKYLYEPNAAILKAGAFKLPGNKFNLFKLHQHSHLYTSENPVKDFPGRIFKVTGISKPDKKSLSEILPGKKANVSIRNFKSNVAEILKKTGIKEGGNQYLFFTTDLYEKGIAVLGEKVSFQ